MKRVMLRAVPLVSIAALMIAVALLSQIVEAQSTGQPKSQPATKPKAKKAKPAAPAGPQYYAISVLGIKSDMVNEWMEFAKNESMPALKKGGVKERSVWGTATFGDVFQYVTITPIESFAQYDGEPAVQKALGREGYQAYLRKAARFVSSVRTFADRERADLSYVGKMPVAPKLAVVSFVQVAPGRGPEFERTLKTDILPAIKRSGLAGFFVSQTVYGGDANSYTIVVPYDTFAEIGKGPAVQRALGDAAYQSVMRKNIGVVTHIERMVARYLPDLSFGGPPESSSK